MTRQQPHRSSNSHPDLATHKDCGLYAVISTLLHLKKQPLAILTPEMVHSFRPYIASQIGNNCKQLDILTLIYSSRITSNPILTDLPHISTPQSVSTHMVNSRLASLRQRRITTKTDNTRTHRTRYDTHTCDPAQANVYVADSTLPGAQKGLFADRLFDGLDEDSSLVGEYFGGE